MSKVMIFKPSIRQWTEYLQALPKKKRANYVKAAVEEFIRETPVITSIPLHESAEEPIYHGTIQLIPTPEISAWFQRIPPLLRSYTIRLMLTKYRLRYPPEGIPQQVKLELEETSLKDTGTGL